MPNFDLNRDGLEITRNIKSAKWFPVKSGNLRDNATTGDMIDESTFLIKFDERVARYIKYLEEGTRRKKQSGAIVKMMNTPRALSIRNFALPISLSKEGEISGPDRFGKHMGFISDKTISYILDYFVKKYKGTVEKI